MIQYKDECVGCPPYWNCTGNACIYRNIPYTYCDKCKDLTTLYQWDDKQLCKDCLVEELNNALLSLDFDEKCAIFDVKEVEV